MSEDHDVKKKTKKKKGKKVMKEQEQKTHEESGTEEETSSELESLQSETTEVSETPEPTSEVETDQTSDEQESKEETVEVILETPVTTSEVKDPEVTPKQEPLVQPAITQEDSVLCPYNRGINNYLIFALDTLNSCSIKEIDKIIRSRISVYENIFSGIDSAPTDEDAFVFITNLLNEINARPYVTHKDRALIGFMRLSTLTKQQANLYQVVWKLLLDTSNPATRAVNSKMIPWRMITPNMTHHKKGDNVNRRLYAYYQRM